MTDTATRLRTLIAQETGVALPAIAPATLLREDLGLDAGDRAYLMAEIESDFGIALDEPAFVRAATVGEVIRLVEGEIAAFARPRRRGA